MSTSYSVTNWAWGDGVTVNARGLRHSNGVLLNKLGTTDTLASRGGIVDTSGDPLKIVPSSGMVLSVTKGEVVVPSSTALDGAYTGYVPSGATVTLTAANATYPRYDRVIATVTDIGTSGSTFLITTADGTPASSPVIPSEPANSITLAVVYVGAGATSISVGNITDYRKYTCAAGGILPVESSTDFPTAGSNYGYFHDMSLSNLWTRIGSTNYPYRNTFKCTSSTKPADKTVGTLIYETDTDTLLCWNGAKWAVVVDVTPKTYTPVWSSLTPGTLLGNGTIAGTYQRQGNMIDVQVKMTCGSTSYAHPSTQLWSLPFAPDGVSTYGGFIGHFYLSDYSLGSRSGPVYYASSGNCFASYQYIAGTEIEVTAITGLAPITWNTGDIMLLNLRYRIA